MDDVAIIRQVLDGRHEQFSLLVERYQERLVHFLRKFVSTDEEAFDCAQEAFLAAYRNLWRYSDIHTFRAWLYSIARNKAMDSLRKRRREMYLIDNGIPRARQPEPEEQWLAKEDALYLRQVVAQLPKQYRQVLYLRYHHDLVYEEIGIVLGIPLSRVKTNLHRGKKKLRQEMERRRIYGGYEEYVGSTVF